MVARVSIGGCQRPSRPGQPLPVLLGALLLLGCTGADPSPPNVLLVVVDTLRADHVGAYGYPRPTSPRLDALADEGVLFRRCAAVANWTLPSHASMLTGLLPPAHGAHRVAPGAASVEHEEPAGAIARDAPSLAEALQGAGYRTAGIVANWWWLGAAYGFDRGFDHYDHRGGRPPWVYRRARPISDAAIAWLEEGLGGEGRRPFFLLLNYMDPHIPYLPPKRFLERFGAGATGDELEKSWIFFHETQSAVTREGRPPAPALLERLVDRYDAEIAFVDAELGRVFDWLRETGQWQDTLVIVTSDHGEAFGENGVAGHGVLLHEAELAVPLIVKLPSAASGSIDAAGRVVEQRVQHVDLLPTVLEVARVPDSGGHHGRSLLRELAGEVAGERDALAVAYERERIARLRPSLAGERWALYRDDLKLVAHADGRRELFDLAADPGETRDLSAERPHELRSLSDSLAEKQRTLEPLDRGEPVTRAPDADTREKLRALGYSD